MKLAAAAAQQLKGVIVEYDVLCSTLLGRSVSEQLARRQDTKAAIAKRQQQREQLGSALEGNAAVGSMFVSDVRALLKDLQQDSTGKPWVVKERLQSALRGLPAHMVDRVTGNKDDRESDKSEDEVHLESQLAAAAAEQERRKQEKEASRRDQQQQQTETGGGSSIRDKYLSKLNKLKAKTQNEKASAAAGSVGGAAITEASVATSKGLSTWVVNDGTNELLSYSDIRGLFKAVLPPCSPLQHDEFEFFMKEMANDFDAFMSDEDYKTLPDPAPILAICEQLGLSPPNVMVVARHAPTIQAAKSAGANTCHYNPDPKGIPNHTAHHQLKTLKDFQYLVEEFNGISYRGKIKSGTIVF